MGPGAVNGVIAVTKAYTTRVGGGPFPTEDTGKTGEHLRDAGAEFGSTTGRPRRCGWLDAVALRRTTKLSGATSLAITKLDVLSGLETINVCTAYKIDGKEVQGFSLDDFERIEPEYTAFEGWADDITAATSVKELPGAARQYLDAISDLIGVGIGLVSVGPGREQTIALTNPFED